MSSESQISNDLKSSQSHLTRQLSQLDEPYLSHPVVISPDRSQLKANYYLRGFSIASCSILIALILSVKTRLRYSDRFGICTSPTASIFTSDSELPFVSCIVMENGTIEFLGSRSDLEINYLNSLVRYLIPSRLIRSDNRLISLFLSTYSLKVFQLTGQTSVLPGLIDSHAHPLERGRAKSGVELLGCTSIRCVIERVIEHINSRPDLLKGPRKFIFGDGWDQTLFESKEFPTAGDLSTDPILKDYSIVLRRIDFHAFWVSRSVLDLIDIPEDSDHEFDGGEIVRDKLGKPTGIFVDNAMDLVRDVLPKTTNEERLRYLKSVSKEMLSLGLTTVNDAAADLDTLKFYKALDLQGKLPVRILAMVDCGFEFCGDQIERYQSSMLTIRSAKLFIDGALGSWGASLWEPYTDKPQSNGTLRVPVEEIFPLVKRWVQAGFQVNSHAIGDRANTIVLDAYEQVLRSIGTIDGPCPNVPRLRIEHAQILRRTDITRMAKLGIFASVQPTHAIADMDYAEDRLGPDRIKGAYAWNSLSRENVTLVFGSDFPVSPVSPFLGIHAALTRKKPNEGGDVRAGWYEEERIRDMKEIIKSFSLYSSVSSFNEDLIGSLKVGKAGDLIVVDKNLFKKDPEWLKNLKDDYILEQDDDDDDETKILNMKVLGTVLNGKLVY
ncbi:amidohydrolase family-domain-containing protein, partial [Phakopsora pachyrhizi]